MATQGARVHRPKFHYTPEKGWINDPNGLIFDGQRYHLFAQHHPDSTKWGPMHWAHAVSDDLIHWTHLPIALYPDHLGMCFSGSAAMVGGKIALMYTSHGEYEQQSVAFSDDGVHFVPSARNPVIANASQRDYRDPKVFYDEARGRYVAAIAAGDHVEFFASPDMLHWQKLGEFSDQARLTGIHECPDVFPLPAPDGSTIWVMIASMILAGGQGNRTQYVFGQFDGQRYEITHPFDQPEWIDAGWNNYAPVTFYAAPEPTILGWASCWAYAHKLPTGDYAGMMTMPRKVSVIDTPAGWRLSQLPTDQWDAITGGYAPIADGGELPGEHFRMKLSGDAPYALLLENDGGEVLRVEVTAGEFVIDFRNAGECGAAGELKTERFGVIRKKRLLACADAELIFDACIAEIFADGGAFCATVPVFPAQRYARVRLEGNVRADIAVLA